MKIYIKTAQFYIQMEDLFQSFNQNKYIITLNFYTDD